MKLLFKFLIIISFLLNTSISYLNGPRNLQIGFQDPATPYMEGIINFHNTIMFLIIVIIFFVSWLLFQCLISFNSFSNSKPEQFTHSTSLEIIWTIIPACILIILAIPSLGVKIDACLGRLNQIFLFLKRIGVFYGQCSEICGINHGFMPIVVQSVFDNKYHQWYLSSI